MHRHAPQIAPIGSGRTVSGEKQWDSHVESMRQKTPAELLEAARERVHGLRCIAREREHAQAKAEKSEDLFSKNWKSVLVQSTAVGAAIGFSEIALHWLPSNNHPLVTALVLTAYIPTLVFTLLQDSRADKNHAVTKLNARASEQRIRVADALDSLSGMARAEKPEGGFRNAARLKVIRAADAISRDVRADSLDARGSGLDGRMERLETLVRQWELARASSVDPTVLS